VTETGGPSSHPRNDNPRRREVAKSNDQGDGNEGQGDDGTHDGCEDVVAANVNVRSREV
jgi:hypothetical protein